jgi:hypothetical protein
MFLPFVGGPSCGPLVEFERPPLGPGAVEDELSAGTPVSAPGFRPECRFAKLSQGNLQGNIQNIELFRLVLKKLRRLDRCMTEKTGIRTIFASLPSRNS